ncbi:MAG: MoxR family ATPase, partial [Lentisphaerae bacterium]|nr:MoxR family ATPase [Lentisphaerota bacterium]
MQDQGREAVERIAGAGSRMLSELGKVIVGQESVIEQIIVTLLARGHGLLVGVPGLGKTLLVKSIARLFSLQFKRIQFTPDLMPADIFGTEVMEEDAASGRREFRFIRGPVFAHILLADEINRTPPKTQAALLQAMQEHQVSVGRKTYDLKPPFMVIATQNPIEMEGTYVLPEAQLDRFMFCVKIAYPSPEEEASIVKGTTTNACADVSRVMNAEELLQLQRIVRGVPVADDVVDYAVRLVGASRPGFSSYTPEHVRDYASVGASPRASQYLVLGAKARALLAKRYHVNFEDVRAMAAPVLRHRIVLNFRSRADR